MLKCRMYAKKTDKFATFERKFGEIDVAISEDVFDMIIKKICTLPIWTLSMKS